MSDMRDYLSEHQQLIESALREAVTSTIKQRAPDPLSSIASLLQIQRISPPDAQLALNGVVASTLSSFSPEAQQGTGASTASVGASWTLNAWLESLNITAVLADALLRPLRQMQGQAAAEVHFAKALGDLADWREMHGILHTLGLFELIAKLIFEGARALGRDDAANPDGAPPPNSKFMVGQNDAALQELSLGDRSMFFNGLDDFIGPPNPNVREAMVHEHCNSKDSDQSFVASNYVTETTPHFEWYFVVEPTAERLATLASPGREPQWPKEKRPPKPYDSDDPTAPVPATGTRKPGPRKKYQLNHFEASFNIKNGLLSDANEKPMTWDEFIGARMYTGPMFEKYNGVLRAIGRLRVEREGQLISETDIENALACDTRAATRGNVYTTTLHVINSACIKLSKLTTAAKVYRGVSDRFLPEKMRVPDKYNVKGGVEFGFMSATLDRRVAMHYAGAGTEKSAILLEMQMGMIDRGADLSWLSQYPHEREILFAPLSALEVRRLQVDGKLCIVDIRLSVNLQALTIEQVISKMQRSHLQLIDLLQDNLRFAGVPTNVLAPLQQLRLKASHANPIDFNVASKYRDSTNKALDSQDSIFEALVQSAVWEGRDSEPAEDRQRKLYRTALLCARVGKHDESVELLKLWQGGVSGDVGNAMSVEERIAKALIDDGLQAPWPGTLAHLVMCVSNTIPDKGHHLVAKVATFVHEKMLQSDPFAFNEPVLVYQGGIWENARVRKRRHGAEKVEGTDFPFEGKKRDGYDVVSWKEQSLVEDLVLAPGTGGPAALLRQASAMGVTDLVAALLEKNRSLLFQCDMHADTALILAAKNGHAPVCKLLHRSGACEHVRNMSRENAYDVANHMRHIDVLRVFSPYESDQDVGEQTLDGARPRDQGENDVTLLMLASREGRLDEVRKLLEARADVSHQSKSGCTALMMAAEEGRPEHVAVVTALLEHDVEKMSLQLKEKKKGKSALALAVQAGNLEVVKLLADRGADLGVRLTKKTPHKETQEPVEKDGRSLLHLACMHGHVHVVELLLQCHAAINDRSAVGDTPIMLAARFGHLDVVKLLLKKECDISAETKEPCWSSIHRACGAGYARITLELLVKHPPLMNHVDMRGVTPLMAAVGADASECAIILIDKGAKVDETNVDGETAVFIAAKAGQAQSLRTLLTNKNMGADLVNKPNLHGETPLMAACKYGHESTARLLVNAKADFDGPASAKENALMIAAGAGHEPIVRMLLNNGAKERKDEAIARAEKARREMDSESSARAPEGESRFDKVIALLHKEPDEELSMEVSDEAQRAEAAVALANTTRQGVTVDISADLDEALRSLEKFKEFHKGQIVPPRPSKLELEAKRTAAGDLAIINGIVVQRGPFNAIWLRAGCVDKVPWSALWQTLKACANRAIRQQRDVADQGRIPQAIWLGITELTLQSIDFTWLKRNGFKFHHYRRAGHVQTVDAIADRAKAMKPETDGSLEPAEFVYYCWPTDRKDFADMVPEYATSIEGATGVLLSPDEKHVLLVHERGSWSTPGGAVNAGEMKVDALAREAMEEVGVDLDPEFAPVYLGGYQQGGARDDRNNDNFSAFVVRLQRKEFRVDNKEVQHAAWFDWQALLGRWREAREAGEAPARKIEVDMEAVAPDCTVKAKNTVSTNLLEWLDTYERRQGMKCVIESKGRNKIVRIGV